MERLNYQHLYYFWTVAKTGSIKAACETLRLAQPTISGQLASFQKAIDAELFRKDGRRLVLTDSGWQIFSYADEIFNIGNELNNWLKGGSIEQPRQLTIGICSNVDMFAALQLLSPVLEEPPQHRLRCCVGDGERLALDLRLRTCDLVIASKPSASATENFVHLLAALQISLFAPVQAAAKYRRGFPKSLDGATVVLPITGSPLRQALEVWFRTHEVRPNIRAEIGESELAKSIAASSGALLFAPTITQGEMRLRYGFEVVRAVEGVEDRIYAVVSHPKIRNPSVARIVEQNHPAA